MTLERRSVPLSHLQSWLDAGWAYVGGNDAGMQRHVVEWRLAGDPVEPTHQPETEQAGT